MTLEGSFIFGDASSPGSLLSVSHVDCQDERADLAKSPRDRIPSKGETSNAYLGPGTLRLSSMEHIVGITS